jgi:hypothetical protein
MAWLLALVCLFLCLAGWIFSGSVAARLSLPFLSSSLLYPFAFVAIAFTVTASLHWASRQILSWRRRTPPHRSGKSRTTTHSITPIFVTAFKLAVKSWLLFMLCALSSSSLHTCIFGVAVNQPTLHVETLRHLHSLPRNVLLEADSQAHHPRHLHSHRAESAVTRCPLPDCIDRRFPVGPTERHVIRTAACTASRMSDQHSGPISIQYPPILHSQPQHSHDMGVGFQAAHSAGTLPRASTAEPLSFTREFAVRCWAQLHSDWDPHTCRRRHMHFPFSPQHVLCSQHCTQHCSIPAHDAQYAETVSTCIPNSCTLTETIINPTSTSCNAHHQATAHSRPQSARSSAPTLWATTRCTASSSQVSTHTHIHSLNPVAAALCLPSAAHRTPGLIHALQALRLAAGGAQHRLRSAISDWAARAAGHSSNGWTAAWDGNNQLGQAFSRAGPGQVSDAALSSASMLACILDGAASLLQLCSTVMLVSCRVLVSSNFSIIKYLIDNYASPSVGLLVIMLVTETIVRLIRWNASSGPLLQRALAQIAAAAALRRMTLRLHLYKSVTGRQFRRTRRVHVLRRPLELLHPYASPITIETRLRVLLVTFLLMSIVRLAMTVAPLAHTLAAESLASLLSATISWPDRSACGTARIEACAGIPLSPRWGQRGATIALLNSAFQSSAWCSVGVSTPYHCPLGSCHLQMSLRPTSLNSSTTELSSANPAMTAQQTLGYVPPDVSFSPSCPLVTPQQPLGGITALAACCSATSLCTGGNVGLWCAVLGPTAIPIIIFATEFVAGHTLATDSSRCHNWLPRIQQEYRRTGGAEIAPESWATPPQRLNSILRGSTRVTAHKRDSPLDIRDRQSTYCREPEPQDVARTAYLVSDLNPPIGNAQKGKVKKMGVHSQAPGPSDARTQSCNSYEGCDMKVPVECLCEQLGSAVRGIAIQHGPKHTYVGVARLLEQGMSSYIERLGICSLTLCSINFIKLFTEIIRLLTNSNKSKMDSKRTKRVHAVHTGNARGFDATSPPEAKQTSGGASAETRAAGFARHGPSTTPAIKATFTFINSMLTLLCSLLSCFAPYPLVTLPPVLTLARTACVASTNFAVQMATAPATCFLLLSGLFSRLFGRSTNAYSRNGRRASRAPGLGRATSDTAAVGRHTGNVSTHAFGDVNSVFPQFQQPHFLTSSAT